MTDVPALSRVAAAEGTIADPATAALFASAALRDRPFSLSNGQPDIGVPGPVLERIARALTDAIQSYVVPHGLEALRAAIVEARHADTGLEHRPEEVVVTAGAQEAFFIAMSAMLDPGDEVLFSDPHYPAYASIVRRCGGRPTHFETSADDGWAWHPDRVAAAITPRTKAIVIVSPDNPTGRVATRASLVALVRAAATAGAWIVADETYERFVYDGVAHLPVASVPGARARTVTIHSFSKTYGLGGYRVGYLVGPERFTRVAATVKEALSICAPVPSQIAALELLRAPPETWAPAFETYRDRRRYLLEQLDAMSIPYARTSGSYYLMLDVRPTGLGSVEFASRILEAEDVWVRPGATFGVAAEGFVRLSLMTPRPQLDEGLRRLQTFFKKACSASASRSTAGG